MLNIDPARDRMPVQNGKESRKKIAAEETAADEAMSRGDLFVSAETRGNKVVSMFEKYVLGMRVPSAEKKPFDREQIEAMINKLQPGDVLLMSSDNYPHWKVLEKVTVNSDFTHAAIYEGDGKFIEAVYPKVIRSDLRAKLDRKLNFEVIRPPYASKDDVNVALDYSRAQIGKPYETVLNFEDDSELGCTELVQRALRKMPNPIDVEPSSVLGRKVVAPDAFRNLKGSEVVFSNRKPFLSMILRKQYPVLAASMALAAAGSVALGPMGGVAGFIGGGLLSIAIGNKMETGIFGLYCKP